jgi:hypothetical protein
MERAEGSAGWQGKTAGRPVTACSVMGFVFPHGRFCSRQWHDWVDKAHGFALSESAIRGRGHSTLLEKPEIRRRKWRQAGSADTPRLCSAGAALPQSINGKESRITRYPGDGTARGKPAESQAGSCSPFCISGSAPAAGESEPAGAEGTGLGRATVRLRDD